jgi:hypothetical protein
LTKRALALAAVVALALGACTRGGAQSGATISPAGVFAAGPTVSDVSNLLGDNNWWPGVPSFGVRPLGLPSTPETVRFAISQSYVHLGTAETFAIDYVVYTSVTDATSRMTSLQTQLGTTATSPRAGDQVIYYGIRQSTKTSLYETDAFIRLGQVVIFVTLTRGSGFVDLSQMGRISNKLVARLKDVMAGKIKPSPQPASDATLLPPPGTDITLVGVARLPIEAAALMLGAASPQDLTSTFHQLGVNDFLFGDFALNADLQMEVRASTFSFGSAADAATWIGSAVGTANLDANGVASGYSAANGQYYAFFASGSHVGVLYCTSTVQFEAASRACEAPMTTIINTWKASLATV